MVGVVERGPLDIDYCSLPHVPQSVMTELMREVEEPKNKQIAAFLQDDRGPTVDQPGDARERPTAAHRDNDDAGVPRCPQQTRQDVMLPERFSNLRAQIGWISRSGDAAEGRSKHEPRQR